MPWRMLLSNWLRQMAQERVMEAVSQSLHDRPEAAAESAAPPDTPLPCHVGLVFALGMEAGHLEDRLTGVITSHAKRVKLRHGGLAGRGVTLVLGGPGQEAAAHAAETLIAGHHPAWVISAGYAGGLAPELARNDILMVDSVVREDGAELKIDLRVDPASLKAVRGVHVGRLLTADRLIRSAEEKRKLGQQHDALAVDMETWAVAEVCRRERTRFLAVRIITDTAEDQLPPEVENLLGQKSIAGQVGAVAGALWKRPSSAKDMWSLNERALEASNRLAQFLADMIRQLPLDASAPV